MKCKIFILTFLLMAVLVTSVSFAACSGGPEIRDGYVVETLTIRDIGFSFEYPVGYEKNELNPYGNEDESDFTGFNYIVSTDDDTKLKMISIQLWNPTSDFSDARTKLDYYIDNLMNVEKNTTIVKRIPVLVGGVNGEKFVFTSEVEDITHLPNQLAGWVAAFDYRGQIWFLVVTTNMEATNEVEADFEHVIESFKFLD